MSHPPTNLHEYQKKRLTEFAFRKSLILKGARLVRKEEHGERVAPKKKSGTEVPHSKHKYLYCLIYHKLWICQEAFCGDECAGCGKRGFSSKLLKEMELQRHFTVRVSWMAGSCNGCCVGDMALMVMMMVEMPGGVTMTGGGIVATLALPQPPA